MAQPQWVRPNVFSKSDGAASIEGTGQDGSDAPEEGLMARASEDRVTEDSGKAVGTAELTRGPSGAGDPRTPVGVGTHDPDSNAGACRLLQKDKISSCQNK